MHENKTFYFLFFYFLMSLRKPGILILDLYLYNIKIQTGIDQNAVKKFAKNHIFKKIIFEELNFFGLGPARPIWLGWTQQA